MAHRRSASASKNMAAIDVDFTSLGQRRTWKVPTPAAGEGGAPNTTEDVAMEEVGGGTKRNLTRGDSDAQQRPPVSKARAPDPTPSAAALTPEGIPIPED